MKRHSKLPALAFAAICGLTYMACGANGDTDNASTTTQMTQADVTAIGRKAADAAQSTLLSELTAAIAEGGVEYAVSYCNLKATALLDSVSRTTGANVSRVTSRARNVHNNLQTQEDKVAWVFFSNHSSMESMKDTVLYNRAKEATYYRPIFIGMDLCLNCHGSRSQDIELSVLERLDDLYPTDPAVNYLSGDLRGLWKVEFSEPVVEN